jgi:hypothetical protein
MDDAQISGILDRYPDLVAEAQRKFKTATLERERLEAKTYLRLKAQAVGGEKLTVEDLKSKVRSDDECYKANLEEIMFEADWTKLYEKLLAAKTMAKMRSAF